MNLAGYESLRSTHNIEVASEVNVGPPLEGTYIMLNTDVLCWVAVAIKPLPNKDASGGSFRLSPGGYLKLRVGMGYRVGVVGEYEEGIVNVMEVT